MAETAGRVRQQSAGSEVEVELAPAGFEFRGRAATHALKNVSDARVEIFEFELK